jgi:acetate kinase
MLQRHALYPAGTMQSVVTINGGSSSIRFALYESRAVLTKRVAGKLERIGLEGPTLTVTEAGSAAVCTPIAAGTHHEAAESLMNWLDAHPSFGAVSAVGHRVVHGMSHTRPARVTGELLAELRRITPYDPEHLPSEIQLIEALRRRYPRLPQVACFDTAFHRTMPRVATLLPIPRRYAAQGVQRYGFHGLSYQYLMGELARRGGDALANGRVILAHLGNGASLAAVKGGRSIDTTMGFTPTGGLVMSSRSGDLDPGVMVYLARVGGMSATDMQNLVSHQSGLLGISETSPDVRDLLGREALDPRAAEALAVFCYEAKKWIGAFTAALGGLDTLVFAGGIGENSAAMRSRICDGLRFAGVELDETRNRANAPLISIDSGPVGVHVIPTDEEIVIARLTLEAIGNGGKQGETA